MRKIINKFKQPIYKDDATKVIINAIISSLLIGILSGAINLIFSDWIGYTFMIFYLMVGYFIGIRIRRSYFTYHIVYSILAVIFTFLGLLIGNVASFLISWESFYAINIGIKDFFMQLNIFSKYFYSSIWNIINFILYIITLVISYKFAKMNE